jgi:hypothetical protein
MNGNLETIPEVMEQGDILPIKDRDLQRFHFQSRVHPTRGRIGKSRNGTDCGRHRARWWSTCLRESQPIKCRRRNGGTNWNGRRIRNARRLNMDARTIG